MPILISQTVPKIIVLLLSFFAFNNANGQVVLYLEDMKEEKPIKYYEGQMLSFISAEYPDEWQEIKIERILVEEKILLFAGGMVNLEDILKIRRSRGWANVTGTMLQTFGGSWFVFGGLAHFGTSSFTFGIDTLVIGATAIGVGWLIKKFFKYKKYKIGKKNRLKILDLSWPAPTGK